MPLVAIADRNSATKAIKLHTATALISILDPGRAFPYSPRIEAKNWLRMTFEDIVDLESAAAPRAAHAERLVRFYRERRDQATVIHCEAGISRSTAGAVAMLVIDEHATAEIVKELQKLQPQANPNPLFVSLLDDALQLAGGLRHVVSTLRRPAPNVIF